MAHLPDDDLPSSFDVVVDGTGLVQSMLAAALARAGKSVLHIDRKSYYGELWASLMHRELEQWVDNLSHPHSDCGLDSASDDTIPPANEDWVHTKPVPSNISNLQEMIPEWVLTQQQEPQTTANEQGPPQLAREEDGTPDDPQPQSDSSQLTTDVYRTSGETERENGEESPGREPGEREGEASRGVSSVSEPARLSWAALEGLKKRFNYDILPKVMFCRGSLVELLTHSNCGRYIEFKALSKIFSPMNGELEQVPCSRADMFTTKSVSMVDKRKMMRFLSFCAEYEDHPEQYQEFEKLPFIEFLSKNDLPANLRQYVTHCIAMVEETTPTIQALKATQLFLTSLGRFGNAPFLYPLYGVGELAQAFCRLCAVFGGVYCLRRHIQTLVVSSLNHSLQAIICSTGQRISCSTAVCSVSHLTTTFQLGEALSTCQISRAIYITDGPIANTKGSLCVVTLPPCTTGTQQTTSIRMLQLNQSTYSSVPGTYVIHATCPSVGSSAEVDLQPLCSSYFSTPDDEKDDKPRLLYALYFNVVLNGFHGDVATPIDGLPRNVHLTSDPSASISFEGAVDEARQIFEQICPGEEFLPPPPDPNDIIYDQPSEENGDQQQPAGSGADTSDQRQPAGADASDQWQPPGADTSDQQQPAGSGADTSDQQQHAHENPTDPCPQDTPDPQNTDLHNTVNTSDSVGQ